MRVPLLVAAALLGKLDGLPPGAVDRLGSPQLRHTCPVACVAFSPDGKRLASGSNVNSGGVDPAVVVWDVASGAAVMRARHDCTAVAWFADGGRVASAGRDGTVKVWDARTGREVFSVKVPGGWAVGVAAAPDGKTLASLHGNRRAVLLWDLDSGTKIRELVPRAAGEQQASQDLAAVAFHPDGKSVAAGVPGTGLVFWDVATGAEVRTIPGEYSAHGWLEHREVAFAGRDALVAVCQRDGLGLYDPATGQVVRSTRGTRPGDPARMSISGVAQSADGSRLALVRNHELKLWDLAADREVRAFQTPGSTHGPFALSPDGALLARADGYQVVLWETGTGRRRHAGGHEGFVGLVGFGPGGEAYTRDDTGLRVWDVGAGGRRRGEPVPAGRGVVALSPDGRTAVHGGYAYDVRPRLTDVATGADRAALDVGEKEGVLSAAFLPGGKHLVTVDLGGRTLSLWDAGTGRRLRRFAGHNDPVDAVAVSPDGKRMATSGSPRAYMRNPFPGYTPDTGVRVWDLEAGAEVRQFSGVAGTLAYSPDGKLLAAGTDSWDSSLRLLDAETGAVVRTLKGPKYGPTRVAFTPDGRTLVSVGRDKVVRLWDVAAGAERRRFDGHAGEVYPLAISADDRRVLTAGGDGMAYVWDVYAPDRAPPADLAPAGRALADPDAAVAFRAVRELVAAGDRAVPVVAAAAPLATAVPPARLAALVADLDAANWAARDKASAALAGLGGEAAEALRALLADKPTPEARTRAERLLAAGPATIPGSAVLAGLRAVEVLERVGTPTARTALARYAEGPRGHVVTAEARTALRRLGAE